MRNFIVHDFLGELLSACPYPENYTPPVEVRVVEKKVEPKKEEQPVNININLNINFEELAKKIKPFIVD